MITSWISSNNAVRPTQDFILMPDILPTGSSTVSRFDKECAADIYEYFSSVCMLIKSPSYPIGYLCIATYIYMVHCVHAFNKPT